MKRRSRDSEYRRRRSRSRSPSRSRDYSPYRRKSRSPNRERKRSHERNSYYSRKNSYLRKRSKSRDRRDHSPRNQNIVGCDIDLTNFDKDEQQKKLEIVMQQRREKVEKWRQEQAKKKEKLEEPELNDSLRTEDRSNKNWTLEDEFDEDSDEDDQVKNQVEIDDSKLILPTKKNLEEIEISDSKVFKNKKINLSQSLKSNDIEKSKIVKKEPKIEEEEEEDDKDPLDAFMEGIQNEIKKTRGSVIQKKEKVINDKKISIITGVAKKNKNIAIQNKNKGELLEQNQDALEYSSEDEQTTTDDLQLMNSNLMAKKAKKLTTISKDEITFVPFEKNFYVEVAELAKMTPEEVEKYRFELEDIKVKGKGCPKPIKTWAQTGVSRKIFEAFKKYGYEKPTPIQAQAIPAIMSGRDVIGIAKTGSGKTLAFLIPMFRHILAQNPLEHGDGPIAIIMTPTRELATQITSECRKFSKLVGLRVVAVYGGTPIRDQIGELKPGAEIVVCTPGRMIDMLAANSGRVTNVRRCTFLVLDEADRMFDMGFEPQVNRIIDGIRPDRQTVVFSATFPRVMECLARRILTKPIEISVGGRSIVCKDIEQNIVVIEEEDKFRKLLEILGKYLDSEGTNSAIVFVDKQENADNVLKELMHAMYTCLALHGGIDQTDRDSTIADFKANKVSVLVATSVAARGLDIKHCIVVINYDCPNHYEDYVHRCGRTGRAGNKGYAWTFITPDQGKYAYDINKALELSGNPTNEELVNLFNNYKLRQEALGRVVVAGGSGFSGKGFKFDEQEAQLVNEKRKFEKVALGLQDSDDEDPEADLNQEIANMLAPKKPKNPLPEKLIATIANINNAATNTINYSLLTSSEKMELVKKAALRINCNLAGKATSNTEAFLKGETNIIQISTAGTGKSLAERRVELLHAKLNYIPKENDDSNENPDDQNPDAAFQRFEEELEINDFPQQARWRVTSKEAIAQIAEYSEAGITVRGTYIPPESKYNPELGERKLYLAIEGTTEWAVSRAKNEIIRLIKEELCKLQSNNQPAMKGRYKVI